jgi:hypothetical protein
MYLCHCQENIKIINYQQKNQKMKKKIKETFVSFFARKFSICNSFLWFAYPF